jgi:hypothetical protein
MSIMLKDAPGGPQLIESLTKAIKDLSLLYAFTDDDKAQASLKAYVETIEPQLIAGVGAGPAMVILDAFASAVMGEKHKIEVNGASRA